MSLVFQKYNADYDLSAKEGADTLAFVSLLEEKLLPALVSFAAAKDNKGFFTPGLFEAFVSELGRFSSLVEFVWAYLGIKISLRLLEQGVLHFSKVP